MAEIMTWVEIWETGRGRPQFSPEGHVKEIGFSSQWYEKKKKKKKESFKNPNIRELWMSISEFTSIFKNFALKEK